MITTTTYTFLSYPKRTYLKQNKTYNEQCVTTKTNSSDASLHKLILVHIYTVVNSHCIMLTFADTEVTIGTGLTDAENNC